MKTARMPASLRDLHECGYDVDLLPDARRFFAKRGITIGIGYRWQGVWILGCVGQPDGPSFVRLTISSAALAEYLDAPSTLIAAFESRGADCRIRD